MNKKLNEYVKKKFFRVAQDLMENPQGLRYKLEKATEKINKKTVQESLGNHFNELKSLIRMLQKWMSREYTGIEGKTILYTIVAVVYFVTPTDFFPDFILGFGFIDDIAVLTWVLNVIKEDIKKFKSWEESQQSEEQ